MQVLKRFARFLPEGRSRTLFSSATALLGIRLFLPLSFLAISILIARLLGVHAFGVYAIVISYYSLFRIVSNFGIDAFLLREIPRESSLASHYLNHALLAGTFFGLAGAAGMNAVLALAGYSQEIRLSGFLLSFALLPDCLNRYAEALYNGLGKNWSALSTVAVRETLKIALGVTAIAAFRSVPLAMAGIAASCFVGFGANLLLLGRVLGKSRFRFEKKTLSRMLRVSAWVAFIGAVTSLLLSTDVIVLSKLRGETAVGYYNAAGKFLMLAFLFIDSAGSALVPVLSGLHRTSEAEFRTLAGTAFRWFTLGALSFVAVVFSFADVWIRLVFGPGFEESVPLLRVLVWNAVFLGNSYFMGWLLFVVNAQKYDSIVIAAACAANVILSVFFTRVWGAMGAAAATLASMILLFAMHALIFRRKVFMPDMRRSWLEPGLAAAVFFAVFAAASDWNRFAGFALGVSAAAAALFCVGAVRPRRGLA